MGLLSFLFGCDSKGDYRRKGGEWYYKDHKLRMESGGGLTPLNATFARASDHGFYREQRISQSDGATFEALSEHYAKDRARVFYCDTYRKGQEYWAVRYNRVVEIEGADAATFQYLGDDVARDARHVYEAGRRVLVKDVPSFALLDHGFSRDRVTGYYHLYAVPGSDGATFTALAPNYARDGASAFYARLLYPTDSSPERLHSVRIAGADVASFTALDDGYARDARRIYFEGRDIAPASATFEVLRNGYAKSETQVFHRGRAIDGADAATFAVPDIPDADVDARDRSATYYEGKRSAP
jgi:hypothetical protein